jgi:cobalamin biosynthesis Mg chelatase CobN
VPTAGISDAGRAGISSNTSLSSSTQGIGETVLPNGMIVNPAALNGSGRLITDVGPSEFIGAVNQGAPAPSLAEVAAHFKTQQNSQNARTITNADVQRLIGSNTNAQTTTVASNMPPSGMPVPAPAQTGSTPQSATSSASASTAAPAQQQNAPAQAASNPSGASAQSTANAGSSTTPQINQGQSGNSNRSDNSHLPATSTILPLLGLLGVASSGIGLWYRKYRK